MTRYATLIALCFAAACTLAAWGAQAETALALQRETLRSEPYIDAPEAGILDKDARIEILRRQGNWALVKAGERQGWVRSLNLRSLDPARSAPAAPAGLLALESGRTGARDLIATTGIRNLGQLAVQTLHDILHERDPQRQVQLRATKPAVKIGRDRIELTVHSREAGHVYVLMVGSDRKSFDLLFPNRVDADNRIDAGATLQLPRAAWPVTAQGPVGADTLLAIVADGPRDYTQAGLRAAGPFLSAGVSDAAAAALAAFGRGGGKAEACAGDRSAAAARCAGSYGAALLTIEEIR